MEAYVAKMKAADKPHSVKKDRCIGFGRKHNKQRLQGCAHNRWQENQGSAQHSSYACCT